jgi:hypothetical protein
VQLGQRLESGGSTSWEGPAAFAAGFLLFLAGLVVLMLLGARRLNQRLRRTPSSTHVRAGDVAVAIVGPRGGLFRIPTSEVGRLSFDESELRLERSNWTSSTFVWREVDAVATRHTRLPGKASAAIEWVSRGTEYSVIPYDGMGQAMSKAAVKQMASQMNTLRQAATSSSGG